MKLSITIAEKAAPLAPFILRGDYSQEIERAAEMGYQAVELHINNPEEMDQASIIASCKRNNIQVSSLGTGLAYGMDGLSLSSSNPEIRERAVQRIASHIRLAKKLDCLVIIGLMKGQVKENRDEPTFYSSLKESLAECLKIAEEEKVVLAVEAINRFESDCMNTLEDTAAFIRPFNSPFLTLHIDTFHMNIEESNLVEPIFRVKDVLGHVHFADNNRMYPGKGFIDFGQIIHALREIDYKGYIALECVPLPNSEDAARGALQNLQGLLVNS